MGECGALAGEFRASFRMGMTSFQRNPHPLYRQPLDNRVGYFQVHRSGDLLFSRRSTTDDMTIIYKLKASLKVAYSACQ